MSLNMNYKAEVVVDTENLSREDWLAYRRLGIGGSDSAAIMGVSPFVQREIFTMISVVLRLPWMRKRITG